jgi:muramoyltetrapeptide carboxypeptidase
VNRAPKLNMGDRVGLVAPGARPESAATVAYAARVVEEMGFVALVGDNVWQAHGHLAGTDEQRLEDLNKFTRDPDVKGIFCIAGGFGALPLLDKLDYDAIAKAPKIFVGSDENTALLLAVYQRCALPVVLGPNLDRVRSKKSFDALKFSVTDSGGTVFEPRSESVGDKRISLMYSSCHGQVIGRTYGGHLGTLVSMMGTPFHPELADAILCLDDYNERYDTLERWLTNLYVSGSLARVSGTACGEFAGCGARGNQTVLPIEDSFGDRLKQLRKPNLFGFAFGRTNTSDSVPIGVPAELDTMRGTMTISHGAVE